MADEMREVDPAERLAAERQRAYDEHQRLAAATQAMNASGMTIEQMRAAVAAADDMKASAAAYAAEQKIKRDLEQRRLAAEQAEQERAELDARQEQVKKDLKLYWVVQRGIYTDAEFERVWAHGDRASLAAGVPEDINETMKAKKRREMQYM